MTLMVVPKMNMTHFWVVDLLMYVRDPQLNFCMNNMSNNYSCMNHYFAPQKRQKYLHATNLRIFSSGNYLLFDNIIKQEYLRKIIASYIHAFYRDYINLNRRNVIMHHFYTILENNFEKLNNFGQYLNYFLLDVTF